jgi:hypothetical protein
MSLRGYSGIEVLQPCLDSTYWGVRYNKEMTKLHYCLPNHILILLIM